MLCLQRKTALFERIFFFLRPVARAVNANFSKCNVGRTDEFILSLCALCRPVLNRILGRTTLVNFWNCEREKGRWRGEGNGSASRPETATATEKAEKARCSPYLVCTCRSHKSCTRAKKKVEVQPFFESQLEVGAIHEATKLRINSSNNKIIIIIIKD